MVSDTQSSAHVQRWTWSTGDYVDNTWPVAALTARTEARS